MQSQITSKAKQICSNCSKIGAVSRCSRCKTAYYCNQECQRKHWKVHKSKCCSNIQKTTHKSDHNTQYQYQGPIIIIDHMGSAVECWGKLSGSELRFYTTKNDKSNIPNDVMNVSQFTAIKFFQNANPVRPFGLVLCNEDESESNPSMSFVFTKEETVRGWAVALNEIMMKNKNNNYNSDVDIVDSVWSWTGNKHLLFVVLRTDKCLYFYENKYDKKHFLKINLNECKSVRFLQNTHKLFKYGFKLEMDSDVITLFFKHNNLRFEWYAHLEFIIDNLNKHKNVFQDNMVVEEKKIENQNEESTCNLLLFVLSKYNEWMHDQLQPLQLNYSYLDILNQFHSVMDDEEFNLSEHECNKGNCAYLLRHIERNKSNNDTNILHQLLNRIHCYISHPKCIRNGIKDKYVINIQQNDDVADDQVDNKQNNDTNAVTFAFGDRFTYYEAFKRFDNYVVPHFSSLKQELTSNPYYKLDEDKYNAYYLKALKFKQSELGKRIKAQKFGQENGAATIYLNAHITINHIMSLMTYCNETELQKIYKKHTRKLYSNESRQSVRNRNKFIANWYRYLAESCIFYGEEMKENDTVYCGVDTKLLFDSFVFENHSPLSTTTSIVVAQNFCMNNGIILKLKKTGPGVNSRYFDMVPLSDFDEKERLFCHIADLKIIDILIDGESNRDAIASLELLQKILSGSLFYYKWNEYLYSNEIQNNLMTLLTNYMNHSNENEYFQQITAKIIQSFQNTNSENDPLCKKIVFINIPQLNKMNQSLTKFFIPNVVLFDNKVFQNKSIGPYQIKHYQKIHFNEQETSKLKIMEYGAPGKVKISDFHIKDHFSNHAHNFQLFIMKTVYQGQHYVQIGIELKPKKAQWMKIVWDIVVPEMEFEQTETYAKLSKPKHYGQYLLLFPFLQLEQLNTLSIDVNVKIVGGVFFR